MTPLLLATLAQVLIGLGAPIFLARRLSRSRDDVFPALALPGVVIALGILIARTALEVLLGGGAALLAAAGTGDAAAPTFAFLAGIGITGGFVTAGGIALGLRFLARGVRSPRGLAVIGIGVGGTEVALRAVFVLLLLIANLRLDASAPNEWDLPDDQIAARQAELDAYFARSPAEPLLDSLIALGRIALGVALTLVVGRAFRTREVGYWFGAALWAMITTAGELLFTQAGPGIALVWWIGVGAVSLVIARRVGANRRVGNP